ncbi:MAG: glycoside hydrolase family 10 protein [Syntrophales bacterium]
MKSMRFCLIFLFLVLLLPAGRGETAPLPQPGNRISLPTAGTAEERGIRGIFGVPSLAGLSGEKHAEFVKELQGVNVLFVPPDEETIRIFKLRGFKVYLTANAFGGTAAWSLYPDARPVLADGRLLDAETGGGHGGVCPTHEGWRAARLGQIDAWIKRFGGRDGIDGIWLDFIRYPGGWEKGSIPDTCYCPRCLAKFQRDTGIALPAASDKAVEAAAWIRKNRPYEWMAWKKEQIASFVRAVRSVMSPSPDSYLRKKGVRRSGHLQPGKQLALGAFVVPWTKGERDGAVTFLLGQDAFALSGIVDVISPMLYHRMTGRDAAWVGEMTAYYREQARSAVWPIIQADETTPEEFAEAVRYAGMGDADGLLAFSFRDLDEGKRRALALFKPPENLIPDSDFLGGSPLPQATTLPQATEGGKTLSPASPTSQPAKTGEAPLPPSWSAKGEGTGSGQRPRYEIRSSDEFRKNGVAAPGRPFRCLGTLGGTSAAGEWSAPLPACEPGETYRFSCLFHRDTWNELSYANVSLWGERFLLEQHLPETFQPLRASLTCPQAGADLRFRFTNEGSRDAFCLGRPRLVRSLPSPAPAPAPNGGFFYPGFFPIGIYGAGVGDLEEIRKLAINTVIIGGDGERLRDAVAASRKKGLRYVLSTPGDPERLKVYLDRLTELPVTAEDSQLAFYVDDEPEMRAVPAGKAEDVQRLVKGRFPGASTGMAIVRPSYCREYLRASDFFMLDQYPFPNMPMSWLADSMDRAAQEAGRDRLLSVIQAFSDGDHWPSLPGWRQMDCLAFLSVVHGSRGIFFYTWSIIGKTPEGRENLGRVVGRLNRVYPWLLEKNLDEPVRVEMLSEYRMDPKGRPAVHACLKRRGSESMLIAVNTLGAPVETLLQWGGNSPPRSSSARVEGERRRISGGAGRPKTGDAAAPSAEKAQEAREVFSAALYPVKNGAITMTLQAYETKVFLMNN